ncbi:MAG: hypothetical protein RLZZ142_600 [Verrucomicrobiota bacterium]|jgi:transcription elongation GreA/GreB family factor
MPQPPLIVSRPSLQALAEAHDRHESEKNTAKREAKVAKEWGDLSENAEYKASKEKFRLAGRLQQRMVRELRKLEDSGYHVVDPLDWTRAPVPKHVVVGTVARVTQGRFTEDYLLVGAKDQHLPADQALVPVPYTSPLGQALMEQSAPRRIEALIAGERRVLQIESLRIPTEPEILALYPELTPP